MSKSTKNFVIIDDKQEEIDKFKTAISTIPDCNLLKETNNTVSFFDYLVENHPLIDYAIIDIKFGNNYKAGYTILEKLHKTYPKIKAIIWSEYPDKSYLQKIILSVYQNEGI